MSICTAPIKIATNSAKSDSAGLTCNYYEGDCTSINAKDCIQLKYEASDQTSNVVYKGDTYTLKKINLYRTGLHTVNGVTSAAELFMFHRNTNKNLDLCICVPVSINLKNTSFGTLLKITDKPNTVYNFQSPKAFIPSGVFYSYVGTNIYQCSVRVEYIVFSSSNVIITSEELGRLPKHAIFKPYEGPMIVYKHSQTTSFGDDKLYIDCQPIDAPESTTSLPKVADATVPAKSITFSDLKNNKFVQMFLMFVIIMIVMVIFFYSYEFTTGMFRELTKGVKVATPT
jgi:carbonic anhydrase